MSTDTAVAVLAQDVVERTSTGEAVQFWILAVVAVVGAIGVVVSTKAVYSAIFLALTMIVLAAFARLVPEERRSWAMGLATAAGSLGQFLFAPLGQAFISGYGAIQALVMLSFFVALVPLLVLGKGVKPGNLGTKPTFADIAATVTDLLGVHWDGAGTSFAGEIL